MRYPGIGGMLAPTILAGKQQQIERKRNRLTARGLDQDLALGIGRLLLGAGGLGAGIYRQGMAGQQAMRQLGAQQRFQEETELPWRLKIAQAEGRRGALGDLATLALKETYPGVQEAILTGEMSPAEAEATMQTVTENPLGAQPDIMLQIRALRELAQAQGIRGLLKLEEGKPITQATAAQLLRDPDQFTGTFEAAFGLPQQTQLAAIRRIAELAKQGGVEHPFGIHSELMQRHVDPYLHPEPQPPLGIGGFPGIIVEQGARTIAGSSLPAQAAKARRIVDLMTRARTINAAGQPAFQDLPSWTPR